MDNLTKEDEILILQEGMKSPFWQLMTNKWGWFLDQAMHSLLDPKYDHRDFLAGKVRGMRDFLSYPERRIQNLQTKTKQEEDRDA
jgi:hypothetical protein